ncbi:MAG: DUF1631 family protein [Pseudomonadales bacterium]|nr:DUF1631 family protein [Pseudomonadales bacterium]
MPQADLFDRLTDENIAAALKGFYTPKKAEREPVTVGQLVQLLTSLPALSIEDHVDPMLVQIQKYHRGTVLSQEHHALLSFIDDAVSSILGETDLDFKLEAFVRDLAPLIAVTALKDGVRAICAAQPILNLMDTLIREGLGWSEDLGVLGEQFMEKIETIVRSMVTGRTSLDACQTSLDELFGKEKPIFLKMETRLVDHEMQDIAGQRAKFHSAQVLNQHMTGKQLPLFTIFMLQGSWYEFLQKLYTSYGPESREWKAADKFTEAFIWALQPQSAETKRVQIMDTLPDHIRDLCQSVHFETTEVEACIGDIEGEFEAIRNESPSDPCDFELIPLDSNLLDLTSQDTSQTINRIRKLATGGWYLYDDPAEPEEKIARLKLLLNWQDSARLLFTNHNRRKILQMTYSEFAANLEGQTIRPLNPKHKTWEVIRRHLLHCVEGVHTQKKREKDAPAEPEKRALTQAYLDKRKSEIIEAVKEHRRIARIKQHRAEILRMKARQKLDTATVAVESLRVDAWLKLPVMEGTLTPCKLVAVIPAADKYIFANRAGLKVGEFTRGQLIQSLIAENSEILDTGAEFESVLSSVVSGLRDNRNKSFDELTGTAG